MMLYVECNDCEWSDNLRGWTEEEDLIGTLYESQIGVLSEEEIRDLGIEGKVKDPMDKFEENPVCPMCGSKNVNTL